MVGVKPLKTILAVLGVIAVIGAVVLLVRLQFDMNTIMGAANANKTVSELMNPMTRIWISAGIAAGAGLLLGLGFGLPRQTNRSVRRETLEASAAQRESTIRNNAMRNSTEFPEDAN